MNIVFMGPRPKREQWNKSAASCGTKRRTGVCVRQAHQVGNGEPVLESNVVGQDERASSGEPKLKPAIIPRGRSDSGFRLPEFSAHAIGEMPGCRQTGSPQGVLHKRRKVLLNHHPTTSFKRTARAKCETHAHWLQVQTSSAERGDERS